MSPFTLRAPLIDDVEAAARVHLQGWVETYRDQLPDEFFGDAALDHRRRMWTWMLGEGASDDRRIVVAEAGSPRSTRERVASTSATAFVPTGWRSRTSASRASGRSG